ncbi:MAG: hypothetical protein ACE5FJ_06280 [Gemmatimonadales bacterium]
MLWDPLPEPNLQDSAGFGVGPAGGGGGGGDPQITYVELTPYRSSAVGPLPTPPETRQRIEIEPQVVRPAVTARPVFRSDRVMASRVRGVGDGIGDGSGRGVGSGGGIGSGQGTGVGSARGPGTGGGPGGIFPPSPRNMTLPPEPRPNSVRGHRFSVHFWVDETGRVTDILVTPRIGDASYRRRFERLMYEYVFNPATTRDGNPIPGEISMDFTL